MEATGHPGTTPTLPLAQVQVGAQDRSPAWAPLGVAARYTPIRAAVLLARTGQAELGAAALLLVVSLAVLAAAVVVLVPQVPKQDRLERVRRVLTEATAPAMVPVVVAEGPDHTTAALPETLATEGPVQVAVYGSPGEYEPGREEAS